MKPTRNAEFGMRNAESLPVIPHSALRTPHCVAGIALGLLMVLVVLLLPAAARACPFCKEALFEPGQLQQKLSTAKGYALSIALLLSVPAALVGSVAALILRAHRRHKNV